MAIQCHFKFCHNRRNSFKRRRAIGGKKVEKKVDTRKKKTKKKRAIIHFRAIDFCLRTTVGGSRTVHKKTEAPSCDKQDY